MSKLKDLTAQELADLLGLPLDKARRWLEVARSISEAELVGRDEPQLAGLLELEFESATSLRRSSVRELMGLYVEEVERSERTGEFHRRYPYFKRRVPEDAKTRLRYLRDLLRDEVEFEARYPAAYELLFGRSRAVGTSFRSCRAALHAPWKISCDSGLQYGCSTEGP